ncbi:MAG: cupin domain-containing protein [Puniceicoccaceae bacterium]
MKIVNTDQLKDVSWDSPKGKFAGSGKQVSEALGRKHDSMDIMERHPFDVEICTVPAGKALCPFHSHSAQWEFYHVISGTGQVRHEEGTENIGPADAFLFKPGEAHQIINNGEGDLVFYIIADNPIGESCHYPDSNKWLVRSPKSQLIRSDPIDYFDGEE